MLVLCISVRSFKTEIVSFCTKPNSIDFGSCHVTAVDCWKAYRYHMYHKSRHKSIPVKHFVSTLAKDMFNNKYSNTRTKDVDLFWGIGEWMISLPNIQGQ